MNCTDIKARIVPQKLVKPRLEVRYPRVSRLPSRAAQTRINHTILDRIYAMIRDQGYLQEPDKEITGTYEIPLNDHGLLSVILDNYAYAKGAAHGLTVRHSPTFNLQSGRVYRLKDLFKPGSDYIRVISDRIKQEIAEKDIPLIAEFEAIKEDEDFYMTEDSLVIYFQLYEYTPYAYGFPSFSIPYEDLRKIVDPEGPVACLTSE